MITTIAGTGTAGFSGDSGLAVQAQISFPQGIAVDGAGNVYFADEGNNRIRRITAGGVISTVAGNGSAAFSGDGGQATSAALRVPHSVAVDTAGNLYIADGNNARIRKITTSGIINTIAGNGGLNVLGDGGPALQGQVWPYDVAVDPDGTVYIADFYNQRVRIVQAAQVTPSGVLNAYSLLPGAIAPGELLTINGSAIGPSSSVSAQPDASGLFEGSLSGVQVLFDGVAAPLISTQASQVQVVAPYELDGKSSTIM